MSVHFDVQKESSCGGHIHVTPCPSAKFTTSELKKIAFAIVVHEDYVRAILPPSRKSNRYCLANSATECRLKSVINGNRSTSALKNVGTALKAVQNASELGAFVQNDRYALWNFHHKFPNASGRCTGTLEFRGCSQFLTTKGTLRWITFVVAFINLALEEVSHWHGDQLLKLVRSLIY
jgi:hypothetical protein